MPADGSAQRKPELPGTSLLSRPPAPSSDTAPARGTVPAAPIGAGALIRRLVHDLRAPMRAINSLTDWVREDLAELNISLPAETSENLSLMRRQAARMDAFLTGLHDYAKAGDPSVSPGAVDAAAEIRRVIAQLPGRAGLSVSFEAQDRAALPRLRMAGADFALMAHHLIHNAVHHHDRDQGRVHVTLAISGARLLLEVQDDGPGIALCDQARVFEPFITLKPRDEVEGAGLGLSIVARIAAALGGQARILSAGRGTLASVALPLSCAAGDPDAPEAHAGKRMRARLPA